MNLKLYTAKMMNLFTENRLLRFVIVALTCAVLVNSLFVYKAVKYQRVVILPPRVEQPITYVNGYADTKYLTSMARQCVSLALTYTPATARKQFEDLLFSYAPEAYPEASRAWYELAGNIEEAKTSSVFFIDSITINDHTAVIRGTLKQFTGETKFLGEQREYLLTYRFMDGRFQVLSLRQNVKAAQKK